MEFHTARVEFVSTGAVWNFVTIRFPHELCGIFRDHQDFHTAPVEFAFHTAPVEMIVFHTAPVVCVGFSFSVSSKPFLQILLNDC